MVLPQKLRLGAVVNTPNLKFIFSVYKPIAKLLKMDVESFKNINEYFDWMAYTAEDRVNIQEAIKTMTNKKQIAGSL